MNRNNGAGIVLPDRIPVQMIPHPGPHADPVVVPVPIGNGVEVHTWGGMTPLQVAITHIAGGLAANPALFNSTPEELGQRAVAQAVATQKAIDEAQREQAKEQT